MNYLTTPLILHGQKDKEIIEITKLPLDREKTVLAANKLIGCCCLNSSWVGGLPKIIIPCPIPFAVYFWRCPWGIVL